MPTLAIPRPQLHALCRRHGVQRLYLFGSAVTEAFRPASSDVDALVELSPSLAPVERGERLLQLWEELEELFQRRVNLLTPESVRNPYLRAGIERTKVLTHDDPRP